MLLRSYLLRVIYSGSGIVEENHIIMVACHNSGMPVTLPFSFYIPKNQKFYFFYLVITMML